MARLTKQQKAELKTKRMAALRALRAIVKAGRCPLCQTRLYRNLALSGWYQCGHLGAEGFQKETGPACNFQFFYDPTDAERQELDAE